MSKLRTGPATLLVHGVPSTGELTTGAVGSGYGRKSGGAVGIGEALLRLVLGGVVPLNPVSSPLNGEPVASGFTNGPKVRCEMTPRPAGSVPYSPSFEKLPIW